jgi:hypothetical protein
MGGVYRMDLVWARLSDNCVLWGEYWGYILIVRAGGFQFGNEG